MFALVHLINTSAHCVDSWHRWLVTVHCRGYQPKEFIPVWLHVLRSAPRSYSVRRTSPSSGRIIERLKWRSAMNLLVTVHCTEIQVTALHCKTLNCTALQYTALHCTSLHYNTALNCTALHYFSGFRFFEEQNFYKGVFTSCIFSSWVGRDPNWMHSTEVPVWTYWWLALSADRLVEGLA